jgi:hypothetical protein
MTELGWWIIGVGFTLCLIFIFYKIAFAPKGYEDENGFHFDEEPELKDYDSE